MSLKGLAVRLAFLSALSVIYAGCVPVTVEPGTTGEGNVNPDPDKSVGKRTNGEPNNTFSQSLDLILNDYGIGQIRGSINPQSDVDVYNLGEMQPGDRIRVDLKGSGFDAAIAIFDDMGRLFIQNDDRDTNTNQLDPFINEVVRHEGINYFLAVAAAPLAPGSGTYTASVVVSRGEPVPPPRAQAVLLDFNGGTMVIPGDATYTVGVFDAGEIDFRYAGMTTQVKQSIESTIRDNFTGVDLDLYTTDGTMPPAGWQYSTVLFGGNSWDAYGISQAVDDYNVNPSDGSIIFTRTFTPDQFGGRVLTADELGRAIGNVATHEIGHLIGLSHVADTRDLMDTTGTAITFLSDQTFRESRLDTSIWPFGYQDGLLLLQEILGITP